MGKRDIASGVNVLVSLRERLDYFVVAVSVGGPRRTAESPSSDAKVFVVHGRNNARKTEVARVLERTGDHEVVILHEQANRGTTLIEKFEGHAAESGYAVVLLTADDVGALAGAGSGEQAPRAREDVVFELGFFFGALGRAQVAVLYEAGVEWPSDIKRARLHGARRARCLARGPHQRAAGGGVELRRQPAVAAVNAGAGGTWQVAKERDMVPPRWQVRWPCHHCAA